MDPDEYGFLAVAELCRRCHEETTRFLHGVPQNDAVCFEVFRRAIALGDATCWEQLQRSYGEQVRSWCRTARKHATADLDELAMVAWERFWRSFTAERLSRAGGVRAVLTYLRACAWSAAADDARASGSVLSLDKPLHSESGEARTIGALLADDTLTPPEELEAAEARSEVWQMVTSHLNNEKEQVLMHLWLEIGLKPREIHAQRPDCFPGVQEVYTTIRNILDRLRRSPGFRRWYEERTP